MHNRIRSIEFDLKNYKAQVQFFSKLNTKVIKVSHKLKTCKRGMGLLIKEQPNSIDNSNLNTRLFKSFASGGKTTFKTTQI